MDNPFLKIVEMASADRICTRFGCTTCGGMELSKRLKEIAGKDGLGLAVALTEVDLGRLVAQRDWVDCVRNAFRFLRMSEQGDAVLKRWLERLDEHPEVADVVLFYILRQGALFVPVSIETWEEWVGACVRIAVENRDVSLLESLVYTLGSRIDGYPGLQTAVEEATQRSVKVKKALAKREGASSGDTR